MQGATKYVVFIGMILIVSGLFAGGAFAREIEVSVGPTVSVSVERAAAVEAAGPGLMISGQLKRLHRVPMVGHLHAYGFTETSELVEQVTHRVAGLNSQRGGEIRIPFRVSMENSSAAISRILLEYHGPVSCEI